MGTKRKPKLTRPEDFIEEYQVKPVKTVILKTLPYSYPKTEWGEHLPFMSTIRSGRGTVDFIFWAKCLRDAEGIHNLPGAIGCLAHTCWQVEGKTYPQWLKYFDYDDCQLNLGLYKQALEESREAKNVFGYNGYFDLISVARYLRSKGVYE